jgi:polysaccharide deacetylase family protein (PEP-CTERM system associated)
VHLFTVHLEDYFQVNPFERTVDREAWDRMPGRVEDTTERLLRLLDAHQTRATFFALGWLADRYPRLIRRILELGHEVASLGYWHKRVTSMSPKAFREDVRASKARLEQVTGVPCLGFRAPSFSIRTGMEWALEILVEEGFRYDSSIFPISRPDYGYPSAPQVPVRLETKSGSLLELPLATTRVAGLRLPAAGGGYLRQLPPGIVSNAFSHWGEMGISAVFYVHTWELDPDQPRLPCSLWTRIRHYRNLSKTQPRLNQLLEEMRFTSIQSRFSAALSPAPEATGLSAPTQPAA